MEVINNLYSRCIRLFLSVSTTFGPLKYKTSIKRTKFSRGQQGDQGWSTCQNLVWDLLVPPGEGMALGGEPNIGSPASVGRLSRKKRLHRGGW